jgi:hypothetical protein
MHGRHYKYGEVSSAFRLPVALPFMAAVLSTEYLLGCQATCSMHESVRDHKFDPSLVWKRGTSHNTTSKCFILDQEAQAKNQFPSSWNA